MALKRSAFFSFLFSALLLLVAAASPREETAGRSAVPLTKVIEHLGFDYHFSPAMGAITIEHGGQRLVLVVGAPDIYVRDRIIRMGESVKLEGDSILIPPEGVDIIIRQLTKRSLRWTYDGSRFALKSGRVTEKVSDEPGYDTSAVSEKTIMRRKTEYRIGAIIIDAGHGGKDPGGIGYNGTREKDIVLEVSRELKRELERRLRGIDIIMTRVDDSFLPLEQRGEIANVVEPVKNPVFLSIHANVSYESNSCGYESYFLSIDPFGESARDVAMKENSVLNYEIENYNEYLKEIINRIVDIEYRRESRLLADFIQKRLGSSIGTASPDRGVKSAFFYVLKTVAMPAVLVEIGFVTNKKEALNLLEADYQRKIARGIAEGVEDFVLSFQNTDGFTR